MNDELVSVVIPAYNSQRYIPSCIDSVLNQSYDKIEVIIVDDGSTDDTINIISAYKDDRIKLFTQHNAGAAVARNYGVSNATGSWIAFVDSDDIWFPDKLEKQMKQCANKVWSHTDLYYLGDVYPENTRATDFTQKHSGNIFEPLLVENSIGTSSVVIKKGVFEEFGGFNSGYRALQDWDFWLRVASKYEVCYCDEALVYYRLHSTSISRNARRTLPFHLALINRVFSRQGVAWKYQGLKNKAKSQSCNICSQISEQENDYLFSSYSAARSLFYQPLDFSKYIRLLKILVKTIIHFLWPFKKAPEH